ncbi:MULTISPECIES: uroporphyrinogen-III C-methyltransferase [unclassified Leisingera]|uniref:uroporphyrinogen-III C-methyltransferase n=1 Tax=unclassified Leisingera TaxID=2614906 RepID=UPI0010123C28|nr:MULTISPECIES: uroporphyrinogen-III C-methyltransferase [unclassified Leisingera]MCF6433221.1 uroporphyrinogen-III C-methyltransferase [Leisingera sp. MMG026]QAX28528.1 uroporphyrinogen-III C-methyltransferase [Leisingera sp. NJS204]
MTDSPAHQTAPGTLALVGAGPGARDLLTLRAMQRLQQADTVFYDRLVDEEVLELAPAAAKRVFVGKHVGAHAWPQDRINAVIVAEALKGRRVVRLKSGDPGIFGRAAEELTAARAAGIETEIIPGVTAACAAAAQTGLPLTERGVSDTLVLTTARCRAGDPLPDCARYAKPGTTIVFYMSVGQAPRIRDGLLRQGMPSATPVTIAVDVSKPGARTVSCGISTLPETLDQHGISGCAIIFITCPKHRSG